MSNWLQILLVLAILTIFVIVAWLIIGDSSVLRAGSIFVFVGTAAFAGHLWRTRRNT